MSIAITEKRPQRRPGGCAGIFFQLFDWNRRLGKKKFFSKKLLPPVRAVKRTAKKFDGEEKIPRAKLLLIANENRGGFPVAKKEVGNEDPGNGMRTPGLLARLMGLESMPVVGQERPRKALDSEYYNERDKSGKYSRLDQDLCREAEEHGKVESRPQKLQKTGGFLEQSAVAVRFCPDVIHSSAATLSRKPQHKLASPLKSPRLLSRNNQTRLMQAATKILEPGLQSRCRSRRAITCLADLGSEGRRSEASMSLKKFNKPINDPFIGPCRSCGGTVDFLQLRCGGKEPVVAPYGFSGSTVCNASSLHCGVEDLKIQNGTSLLALHARVTAQGNASMEKERHTISYQVKCKPQDEMNPKFASKCNISRRAGLPVGRDNVVHGAKLCSRRQVGKASLEIVGTRNFAGVKKNINTSPGLKSASVPSSSNGVRPKGNVWEKNLVRKRRSNCNLLKKVGSSSNPNLMKQSSLPIDISCQKDCLIYGRAINQNCLKCELQKRVDADSFSTNGRDNDIVSFTFSSPIKHKSPSFMKKTTIGKCEERMEQTNCTLHPKRFALDDNKDTLPLQRSNSTLSGDKLRNILKVKIRELNSLEDDELGISDTLPGRSTASILKELISALTTGESAAQIIHDNLESEVSTPKASLDEVFMMLSKKTAKANQVFDINLESQKGTNVFNAASMVSDSDHSSPISIFDASFSNETCSIGTHNGSLDKKGRKTHIEFTDLCNNALSMDLDSDLMDSATSVDFSRCNTEKLLNTSHSSSSVHSISYKVKLVDTKISVSNDAIANTKLLIENIFFYHPENKLQYSINSLLLDMLSAISNALISKPKSCLSVTEAKEMNHLKDFAFDYLDMNHLKDFALDYLIERLGSRFNQFCMSGYKMWLKLPILLKRDQFVKEIYNEIVEWMDLAGMFLDSLIQKDLCSSTAVWTAYEAEACQTGMDIESGILQVLVDEMVIEFCV